MIKFKGKKDVWKLVSIILAILLVCALVYLGVSKYKAAREAEKTELVKFGIQQGYEYAISQIMQQASSCQPLSVYSNNVTMNLIDFSCLNASKK